MKVAVIADQHWGVRNDNQRYLDYYRKFYEEVFFPAIDKHEIKTIFNLGDIFDRRKFVNFHSLAATREIYFDEVAKRGIHQYAILGNHDTYFKDTNAINSPSMVLADYDNLSLIEDAAQEIHFTDGTTVLFVPWITPENRAAIMEEIKKSKADYCLGHFEFHGYLEQQNRKADHGLDPSKFKHFRQVLSGHFHHRHYRNNIFYVGNPAQIYWNDYGDERGFHIWDTDTNEFEFFQNPNTIFRKIYYNDEEHRPSLKEVDQYSGTYVKLIVDKKTDPVYFESYVSALEESNVADLQIVDVEYLMSANDLSEEEIADAAETVELIRKYVDNMDENPQKQKLKSLLENLYTEAQTIEI